MKPKEVTWSSRGFLQGESGSSRLSAAGTRKSLQSLSSSCVAAVRVSGEQIILIVASAQSFLCLVRWSRVSSANLTPHQQQADRSFMRGCFGKCRIASIMAMCLLIFGSVTCTDNEGLGLRVRQQPHLKKLAMVHVDNCTAGTALIVRPGASTLSKWASKAAQWRSRDALCWRRRDQEFENLLDTRFQTLQARIHIDSDAAHRNAAIAFARRSIHFNILLYTVCIYL